MKRPLPSLAPAARGLLEEREIEEIERAWPNGLTSRQIVDVFEDFSIRYVDVFPGLP